MVFVGAATVLAPAAYAGPTISPTVHCSLPAGQGTADGVQTMKVDFSPAVVAPGGTVSATVTLGPSPATSPISTDVPTRPTIDLAMSGGATGTVTVSGTTVTIPVVANQPIQTPVYTGTFNIPTTAAGPITFTPVRTLTYTKVFGSNYETPCDITSGGGSVGVVTATGGPGTPATLDPPAGELRPGATYPLSGALYTPNATPTAQVCAADGSACDSGKIAASTLALDAGGTLTGTVTLATGIPNGSYKLQVADGTKSASASITIKTFVPSGPNQIRITPNRGPLGTSVHISGSNYQPSSYAYPTLLDAAGAELFTDYVETTFDGTFEANIVVSDPLTAFIGVYETTPDTGARLPFTIANDPPTLSASATTSHPGGSFTVSGTNWAPNAPVSAQLCDASGCSAAKIASGPITTNASGVLNGTVTLASSGINDGQYTLKLSDGAGSASTALKVQRRWIELDKTSGSAGSWVKVTGHGFGSSVWINVNGLNASGGKTSDWAGAWALPNGDFCIWIWMTRGDNTGITASETFHPDRNASTPWTVTG
jgi:hypothetical protein